MNDPLNGFWAIAFDYHLQPGEIPPTAHALLFARTTSAQLMAAHYVPGEVRDFILKHIASVAQIEALLLIWSNPEERWGLPEIAARIYASETETAKALERLSTDGFVVCTNDTFRLNASAENIDMIRRLQEVYARHLIPVTDIIHGVSRNASATAETFLPQKRPMKCT